jgi:DNA-binding GntR family transcriptional regulator
MVVSTPAPNGGPDSGHATSLAYSAIRDRILSGELAGGHKLREDELATMIGVSRTPIREALRSLAAEGLVNHERNRGFQVESWTLKDLEEVYSLRSLLEPYATGRAATSGLLDIGALAALAEEMDDAIGRPKLDVGIITELNNRFHDAIMEASGNQRLRLLVNSVVQVPIVRRTFFQYTPEDLKRSLAHHRELVESLRLGDAVWAEAVMRAHMRLGWISTQRQFHSANQTLDSDPSGAQKTS